MDIEFVVPDVTEAIVGYRAWRVTQFGALTGVYKQRPWGAGVNVSHCEERGKNVAPCPPITTCQNQMSHLNFAVLSGYGLSESPVHCPYCHDCGFYAWREVQWLDLSTRQGAMPVTAGMISGSLRDATQRGIVAGEVWMWGATFEHEFGFRAEKVAVKAIYAGRGHQAKSQKLHKMLKAIAKAYKVPITEDPRVHVV